MHKLSQPVQSLFNARKFAIQCTNSLHAATARTSEQISLGCWTTSSSAPFAENMLSCSKWCVHLSVNLRWARINLFFETVSLVLGKAMCIQEAWDLLKQLTRDDMRQNAAQYTATADSREQLRQAVQVCNLAYMNPLGKFLQTR